MTRKLLGKNVQVFIKILERRSNRNHREEVVCIFNVYLNTHTADADLIFPNWHQMESLGHMTCFNCLRANYVLKLIHSWTVFFSPWLQDLMVTSLCNSVFYFWKERPEIVLYLHSLAVGMQYNQIFGGFLFVSSNWTLIFDSFSSVSQCHCE